MAERSEFELPVPFLNSQTTALFYVCDARTKTAWRRVCHSATVVHSGPALCGQGYSLEVASGTVGWSTAGAEAGNRGLGRRRCGGREVVAPIFCSIRLRHMAGLDQWWRGHRQEVRRSRHRERERRLVCDRIQHAT
jgi:hypothetical protein